METRETTQRISCLQDARRHGSIAFLHKDKLFVNRKIYELEYLKLVLHTERQKQIRDSPTSVKVKEMSQSSIPTQNQEIPEQERPEKVRRQNKAGTRCSRPSTANGRRQVRGSTVCWKWSAGEQGQQQLADGT
jgi:hypothetical protein